MKCDNCEKAGLPILPVRYTVLPKKAPVKLPDGLSGHRVTDVALTEHRYGVRTLREGWVYLFYERGARGNRYWEAYRVTEDGRLWKQSLPLPREPHTDPACAKAGIAVPMDIIAIEQPHKCGKVYIAFSEHTWHQEVFEQYANDAFAALREHRMQAIEPASWINGGADPHGHAVEATERRIDDVVEYMPGFDPKQLELPAAPHPSKPAPPFSDATGAYKSEWLQKETTRYPLHIRQATPDSASAALVKLMHAVGETADGKHHRPMMLGLWDAVGVVHELNGFRNEPLAWLNQYASEERRLQVAALNDIETAHRVVRSKEEQELNTQEDMAKQAQEMTGLGRPGARAALAAQRVQALASASPSRVEQINAYYDDMNWMAVNQIPGSYQTRLYQLARSTNAVNPAAFANYTNPERDRIMADARAFAQAKPGSHDRALNEMTAYRWSVYEARLDRPAINLFSQHYRALQHDVYTLQETRSDDVGQWLLKAPLLLDTLEDYNSNDVTDSLAFEIVVSEALCGLANTPKGKNIVDALVNKWDPTQAESLIWRVIALNKISARIELRKMLETARAHKDSPLDKGFDTVAGAAAGAKTLIGYYKNLTQLALETDEKKITPIGNLLRRLEIDQFGMVVGDAIFAKFRVNQLGDFVGEKIIQTLLLQRAGVSYEDAMDLVRKQAEVENASRQETIQRLLKTRGLLRAPAPEGSAPATQALYDIWGKVKLNDDGVKQLRTQRIAVVAALLEAVNFAHLLAGAPDNDTRLKLVQSGASLCASVITIVMSPYYATIKESIRAQSWKFVGGTLGGAGSMISAWMDIEKAATAQGKGQGDLAGLYYVKFFGGFIVGSLMLIDSTSTAAPLLKKLAVRYGSEAVAAAVEAFTERAAVFAGLRAVGMIIGWEGTIGLLLLQALADWVTPDALEAWCSRCAFGTGRETLFRVTDHDVKRYIDCSQQDKDFIDAMARLS
ncbi:hypothetical protein C9I57_03040 [Trinickia symbiotica]|uniref:Toxin VasX N-terminal region domain-containing protein n=2 Tax=Trinickia symbiotica TaxID=863227 RepID=A0A2T3Y1W3_9BURK|nr:hypothetical protein C9I57_03040 [Trinickia symbiotica]